MDKIRDINSINDLLDFKLSIKTILILAFICFVLGSIFIISIFGGINNTIDYAIKIIEERKRSLNSDIEKGE